MIDHEGKQLGVMRTDQARAVAEGIGLDLVEVSPQARPPVCKIMDYGKYKYEESKKKQEAKKKQGVIQLKEEKLRPSTDDHDVETKLKHIRRFLEEGDKAKITITFRGREMAHRELGMAMLKRMLSGVADIAKIELEPKQEGRFLSAVVTPLPKGAVKKRETEQQKQGVESAKIENQTRGA